MLKSVELFTGAGGLALGVAKAGYKHLALVERDKHAVSSLNSNRTKVAEMSDWPIVEATDVDAVGFEALKGQVHLLAAGAPCQPFSLGGKHAGHTDDRNLFPQVFRAVRELSPSALLVENVKGLLRTNFSDYFQYILAQARFPSLAPGEDEEWRQHHNRILRHETRHDPEYVVHHVLLNAADFGVPQKRERVFIVALKANVEATWRAPKPTHSKEALYYSQYVTGDYWIEHQLAVPPVPARLTKQVARLGMFPPKELRWRTVRDTLRGLVDPPAFWDGNGGDPSHVGRPGARAYPGHTGSALDYPAKTLKAGDHGVPGGENTVVDDEGRIRYLSVREAARIQTFPDSYQFSGAWTEGFRQLGNAVPVKLAEVVARSIKKCIEG